MFTKVYFSLFPYNVIHFYGLHLRITYIKCIVYDLENISLLGLLWHYIERSRSRRDEVDGVEDEVLQVTLIDPRMLHYLNLIPIGVWDGELLPQVRNDDLK